MWDLGEKSLWWEKSDEDKRKIVILDIWLSTWIFAEKAPAMMAHFAGEPGIIVVSIDDLRWKTRDEVKDLILCWEFREVWFAPIIEDERGITISKAIDITDWLFVEKVVWTSWHVWVCPKDLANQIQEIIEFQIKSRENLEIPKNVFERETRSTKSFIKEKNRIYARKKWRK